MSGVVVLAGGTGGAKLARGMLDVVGADLTVVANTGDDVELYGAYVSPDPDLCTFWLADRIDARGWGLDGDTFNVMDGLREQGVEVWFNLGDRDLAIGVERARRLANGTPLTTCLLDLGRNLGLEARVLPMADAPVRTRLKAEGRWWDFQEHMVVRRGAGPIEDVVLEGIDAAAPPQAALDAIAEADAIVLGPSNPVISLGPILAVPGMADALRAAAAPVVMVSPIVGGAVLKGPTDVFLAWAGVDVDAGGVLEQLGGPALVDGVVHDEADAGLPLPSLVTDTRMDDQPARARLAREVLDFARSLA